MVKQEISEEKKYMNVAKAIGICLIVFGHSFPEESNSSIRSFLYLFHVPFFFIVSGYFFKVEYAEKPFALIVRRIKSLWVPFFSWSVPFILLHNFFFALYIYSPEVTFRGAPVQSYSLIAMIKKICFLFLFIGNEQLLGGFWFLSCLFFTVVIFLVLSLISLKIKNKYALFLLSSLCFVGGNLLYFFDIRIPIIPYDIRICLITTFLYFVGNIYKKYEKLIPMKFGMVLVSVLLLILVNDINFIKIDSIYSTIGNLKISMFYLIATPILGTYCIIFFAKFISAYKWSNIFDMIGRMTITILALHFLCFKLINLLIVSQKNLNLFDIAYFPVIPSQESWFFAYSFVGICIPVALHLLSVKAINTFRSGNLKSETRLDG